MSLLPCLVILAAIVLLLRVMSLPLKLVYKLIINTICGYLCLILINLLTCFTGVAFSMNIVTAVIVGFLGVPGIGLLFLLNLLLF